MYQCEHLSPPSTYIHTHSSVVLMLSDWWLQSNTSCRARELRKDSGRGGEREGGGEGGWEGGGGRRGREEGRRGEREREKYRKAETGKEGGGGGREGRGNKEREIGRGEGSGK